MKIGTKVLCIDGDGEYTGYVASIDDNNKYCPYSIVKNKKDIGKSFYELFTMYRLEDDFQVYTLEDLTEVTEVTESTVTVASMTLVDYQAQSKRTLNQSLTKEQTVSNMIMGILGETGEVADIIKKHYYQGHYLDIEHMKEEIGDVMFYIVNLCNILDLNLETLLYQNHEKLKKRYPNGFSEQESVNR